MSYKRFNKYSSKFCPHEICELVLMASDRVYIPNRRVVLVQLSSESRRQGGTHKVYFIVYLHVLK